MIDVPGAAQVRFAVEDDNVVVATTFQLDRGIDATESGTHDDEIPPVVCHRRR